MKFRVAIKMISFHVISVDVKEASGKSRLQNSAQHDHEDVWGYEVMCMRVCGHTYMPRKYLQVYTTKC